MLVKRCDRLGLDGYTYSEETNTGHDNGANMVPAEWCLVNFSESKTSSLVGIRDVSVVVVKIVEGSIASCSSGCHFGYVSLRI